MKVAIVGAGLTGLAAARTLSAAGHAVTLFEKSRGVGGRLATRRVGSYTFDTGATSLSPRGMSLETAVQAVPDRVQIALPIHTHDGHRISAGDPDRNRAPRYAFAGGMTQLAKHLASGIDLRLNHRAERLEPAGDGWLLTLAQEDNGTTQLLHEEADAVILTAPAPQSAALLQTAGEDRPLGPVRYRACLSVLLGFAHEFRAPWFALIEPNQIHPLTWLSAETLKTPSRAPDGHTALVAQMSARYSTQRYESEDDKIIQETVVDVARLLGPAFATPEVAQVKRWRYSQPEALIQFDTVNKPGQRLIVAGDGLRGGRAEQAYESGLLAARLLLG